ncbi:MAG: hypothetical protein PVG63_01590, partial [Anaerolineales bacterium]
LKSLKYEEPRVKVPILALVEREIGPEVSQRASQWVEQCLQEFATPEAELIGSINKQLLVNLADVDQTQ